MARVPTVAELDAVHGLLAELRVLGDEYDDACHAGAYRHANRILDEVQDRLRRLAELGWRP
jgi:hypothetical protein